MSAFGSSIAFKKRLIIKNPDGSYSHCYKSGERDSTADTKLLSETNQIPQDLTVSDSELQFIIENYDQFEHTNIMEQLLQVLRRNQIILYLLLFLEMSFTIFLLFITWKKKESSITMLQQIYKDVNAKEAALLFYIIFIGSFLLNIIFYPLGFVSLIGKKVQIFRIFSTYTLYTAIFTIFTIYINILFVALFIIRLIIYTLSRFIINLLISILVLPRYSLNNHSNTMNYQTL